MKQSYRILVLEFISIILGIVLGFIVTEWREHKANRAQANNAFERILSEAESNYKQLSNLQKYYHTILGEIDSLDSIDKLNRISDLPSWNGSNPPLLKKASYDVALSTGTLDYLDFEIASSISEVYSFQEAFTNFILFSVANSTTVYQQSNALYFWYNVINVYAQYSDGYLQRYQQLQDKIATIER